MSMSEKKNKLKSEYYVSQKDILLVITQDIYDHIINLL